MQVPKVKSDLAMAQQQSLNPFQVHKTAALMHTSELIS